MTLSKAIFVCACVAGLTQFLWSQNSGFGISHEKGIPGYLDAQSGKFSTQIQGSGGHAAATPELTGTPVFFREQFNITISNFDQPSNALAVCYAEISTFDDANGAFDDSASVTATLSGGTWTCDVPILTLWTLKTPGSDSISACVHVSIFQAYSVGSATEAVDSRDSSQPCLTLSVPANGQTVVNTSTFNL